VSSKNLDAIDRWRFRVYDNTCQMKSGRGSVS